MAEPQPSRTARPVLWQEITAILLIVMEISWLFPWARTTIGASFVASQIQTVLVLGSMMLVAYLLTRLFDSLRLVSTVQRAILLILFIASVSLSIRLLLDTADPSLLSGLINLDGGVLLLAIVSLWCWWRGIGLARTMIGPGVVWGRFWFGLIMLVIYLLVINQIARTSPGLLPFSLFLLSGLLALVVGRVTFISQSLGSRKNPLGRNWLATIGLAVGGFVGLSMLFASLLTGQFGGLLQQVSGGLRWLVVGILFVISIPWLILSFFLSLFVAMIQNSLPELMTPTTPTAPAPYTQVTPFLQPELPQPIQPSDTLQMIVTLIFWSFVVLMVLIYFARTRREYLGARNPVEEEIEALLDRDDLLRQMRKSLLQAAEGLGNRLRGRSHLAAQIVRQIYARLLDRASEINHPRPKSLTPLEFLPVLELAMPGLSAELDLITQAYVRVRYGEFPESESDINALQAAWQRIETQTKRLVKQARRDARLAEIEQREKQKRAEEVP